MKRHAEETVLVLQTDISEDRQLAVVLPYAEAHGLDVHTVTRDAEAAVQLVHAGLAAVVIVTIGDHNLSHRVNGAGGRLEAVRWERPRSLSSGLTGLARSALARGTPVEVVAEVLGISVGEVIGASLLHEDGAERQPHRTARGSADRDADERRPQRTGGRR